MSKQNTYRGLWVMLTATGLGVLAFFALPQAAVPFIVPACFLAAIVGLAAFYRDFLKALRQ